MLDEQSFEREMGPPCAIPDNRPKYLLSMNCVGADDHGGIRQACVVDWLLEG